MLEHGNRSVDRRTIGLARGYGTLTSNATKSRNHYRRQNPDYDDDNQDFNQGETFLRPIGRAPLLNPSISLDQLISPFTGFDRQSSNPNSVTHVQYQQIIHESNKTNG